MSDLHHRRNTVCIYCFSARFKGTACNFVGKQNIQLPKLFGIAPANSIRVKVSACVECTMDLGFKNNVVCRPSISRPVFNCKLLYLEYIVIELAKGCQVCRRSGV